jgi:hypothetical protein
MPSPFPGMDPFIESQRWEPFHSAFIPVVQELLVPQLRPRYLVDIQKYTFLIDEYEAPAGHVGPDVSVVESGQRRPSPEMRSVATLEPHLLTVAMPLEFEQKFLVIRSKEGREVVAVLELLSPWNKSQWGQPEYLQKRTKYFKSAAHVIEIDLLHGGERLLMNEPLPPGDYFAFVARSGRRPMVEVYAWSLRDQLPTIPIPLREQDSDAALNLQLAMTLTYDRGGYDYALDYGNNVEPPLSDEERGWVNEQLAIQRSPSASR